MFVKHSGGRTAEPGTARVSVALLEQVKRTVSRGLRAVQHRNTTVRVGSQGKFSP